MSLGQPVDWDALYASVLPRVYNYFRYRVGDGPVAEDLTAATFEKAWRARARYRRDRAAFTTWLFTIARNVATDHYRRQRATVPLDAIVARPGELSVEETVPNGCRVSRRLEGLAPGARADHCREQRKDRPMVNKLAVAGPNSKWSLPEAEPAGFWPGFWHGLIAPITFIVSLFNPGVRIYETNNSGGWYDFGFILGASSSLGGSASVNVRQGEQEEDEEEGEE